MSPAIEERLAAIAQLNGGKLTPELVLADAEDPTSPLHDTFTWDNDEAAKLWRIEQARRLIRSVKVSVSYSSVVLAAPRYVRDPDAPSKEQGYIAVPSVVDDRERARRVLHSEMMRVRTLLERAQSVAVVLELANEFNELLRLSEFVLNAVRRAA